MRFEEMMQRYKEGNLSDEEKSYVEEEIRKYEIISEYLYEDEIHEEDFIKPEGNFITSEVEKDAAFIQKAIRKAFCKMGVTVCIVTLAIILFCIYGLSPLLASFYYKPGKEIGEWTNQISMDWAVYSELTMMGDRIDDVRVEDEGFGKYKISFYAPNPSPEDIATLSGEVKKGRLHLYNKELLKNPPEQNLFENMGGEENAKEILEEMVQSLDEGEAYRGYVRFKEDMEFEDMVRFLTDMEIQYPEWIGIRTEKERISDLGYAMNQGGKVLRGWDEKKYPELISVTEEGMKSMGADVWDEEWCTTHFRSMLQYMAEQKEFRTMMNEKMNFDAMDTYIEENGLNCYGMVIQTNKEELARIINEENIADIDVYVE